MVKKGPKVRKRGKHKHRPGKSTKKFQFYKIEGAALKKLRRVCPKCGPGVFMGEHKDRFTCGRCSYTEFKKK